MVYECSGPRFDQLKNPYTGEPMHPKMSVSATGRLRFFAPDTYTPSQPFPTAKEAYRAWNRVNGIEGLKDTQPIVCAYTGKPLHLVHDDEGFHYEGGYDPRLMMDRPTFLYHAAMRDGKSMYPAPTPEKRVDKPQEIGRTKDCAAARHVEEHKAELTEDTIRTAEDIMRQHKDLLDSVSVVAVSADSQAARSNARGRRSRKGK